MERIELSISPDYVSSWGVWEAVREVLQNAIDRELETDRMMEVNYDLADEDQPLSRFTVISRATKLSRRTLLLGRSSKASGAIGQYGEGYKLAMAVLLRAGKRVAIVNGDELWIPEFVHSDRFDEDVLAIRVEPWVEGGADLLFTVEGITDSEHELIRRNCLRLSGTGNSYETKQGRVLVDKEQERRIYVGGLYVCAMPDKEKWLHGFDFKPGVVNVDRDRRLVAQWQVELNAARMFEQVDDAEQLADLVEAGAREVRDVYEYGEDSAVTLAAADILFQRFIARHGNRAIATDDEKSRKKLRLEYQGARVVVVGDRLYRALKRSRAYEDHLAHFERRVFQSPADFLKKWAEDHVSEMPPALFSAFCDDVLPRAESWAEAEEE